MTETRRSGVGMNAEPDDFSARYDRLVVGGGELGWALKTLATLLAMLGLVGLLSRLLVG